MGILSTASEYFLKIMQYSLYGIFYKINNMNSPDLNPIENLWRKFLKNGLWEDSIH